MNISTLFQPVGDVALSGICLLYTSGLLRKVFICGTEWIVFFFYQIFKRDFPLAAAAYAPGCVYGSVANNGLAKGIVCMPDMFLILFVFGHGKSPLSE